MLNSVEEQSWQIVSFHPPKGIERPLGVLLVQSSSLEVFLKTTEAIKPGTLFVFKPAANSLEGLYRVISSKFLSGSLLWLASATLVTIQPTPDCLRQARACYG